MARRWRLRNKLLLGLGLVVGCVGALIAGTAYGLSSYMRTMKTTDSKLAELLLLDELKPAAVAILVDPSVAAPKPAASEVPEFAPADGLTDEARRSKQQLARAKAEFAKYKATFDESVRRGLDPDPFHESQLVAATEKTFADLEAAIDQFGAPQVVNGASKPLASDEAVARQHRLLLKAIDDLRIEVAKDMYDRITQARGDYRRAIVIVGTATGVALLLMLTLVSLFSGWVFRPIRDLQAGVRRVTEGDFNQPIDLKSGDELEDLAVAFNGMTARLHEVYRDLERQVDERSRQLVRSERMVSVGFLAAGVAHEINNPLASIAFCSEALQTRLQDYLARNPHETDVIQKYLRMIQQEAFRCKGITSRLLEFSRVGERRREPTDLAELIQGVLEIAQHLQSCRGKRIIFQPYSRVVAGVCGEDVKGVVLNLVVNALENMEEGGVLTITLKGVGPNAEMMFTDTGCGMAPDVLENIFEPFFTRSRTGKGTGLGLFISHHIVSQHGGEFRVSSPGPGQGSTFTVRVPLTPGLRRTTARASCRSARHGSRPGSRRRTELATPPNSLRVLFVDDEVSLQELMRSELPRLGHEVTVCPDGRTALRVMEKATFDAAILDLKMPDMTGIQVLERLKQVSPDTEAVMMTGYASKETAVEAMRLGAFDYIEKPCKLVEIEAILLKIVERRKLKHQNIALKTRVQAVEGPNRLIGESPAMQTVQRLIATIAPTDATVLIQGETGTGKDVVARTIYQLSKRADMPFVPVNCGALSPTLVESQLFGHRKGAFTGADRDHKGFFEVANGGTLFLDELGELDKNIQVKLLRFLESGEIYRIGDTEPLKSDVRIICATNRDLRKMIAEEDFREDLLYRLNTFEIHLPPLRERKADIPALAKHLLARTAKRPAGQVEGLLTPEALAVILDYDWKGNIRELANTMEYAYILAGGSTITPAHLPQHVRTKGTPRVAAAPAGVPTILPLPAGGTKTLHDIEMEHILRTLEKNNGNKPTTAKELGISLKTLYNKLNRWEEEKRQAAG